MSEYEKVREKVVTHLEELQEAADNSAPRKWFSTQYRSYDEMLEELHKTEATAEKLLALYTEDRSNKPSNRRQAAAIRQQLWFIMNIRRGARVRMIGSQELAQVPLDRRRHTFLHHKVAQRYLERTGAALEREARGA